MSDRINAKIRRVGGRKRIASRRKRSPRGMCVPRNMCASPPADVPPNTRICHPPAHPAYTEWRRMVTGRLCPRASPLATKNRWHWSIEAVAASSGLGFGGGAWLGRPAAGLGDGLHVFRGTAKKERKIVAKNLYILWCAAERVAVRLHETHRPTRVHRTSSICAVQN